MRIKNYIKKLNLFNLKERFNILLFSAGTLIHERLNKNIFKTYLVFAELQRQKVSVEKIGDSNRITRDLNGKKIETEIKRDSSDALVFEQLILEEEYLDIIKLFQNNNLKLETMIDAGANIGLAALYFKAFYPDVKIVALEPSEETYQRLLKNLKINNVEGVTALKQGVWKENSFLHLDKGFRDKSDWAFRLLENKNPELNTIKVESIETLLRDNNWERLDLLKMDIEGGEAGIFESQEAVQNWISKVKVIVVEIHDEYNCRERIYDLFRQNHFSFHESKSLTVAINTALN